MNEDFVLDLANKALKVTILLGAPMLISAMVVGIAVSIFQAVTQINEQTLSFIPKLLVIGAALVLFRPWMIETMATFPRELIINIPNIVAGQ
jgi:flagellar biosynthesis protein FliQ